MTDTEHYAIDKIRNIGLIAHIDAGKTTVTERLLFYTGMTHQLGSVDDGNTVTDWMPQERERGITIVSAAVTTQWRNHQINIIDTPGHIDFTAEVQRALRVLDGGVVIFDGVQGVEPQSETVWRQANDYQVPRLCFINKLDRTGADFGRSLASIRDKLGANAAPLQLPVAEEDAFGEVIDLIALRLLRWQGDQGSEVVAVPLPDEWQNEAQQARLALIEQVAEVDDQLLESYLDQGTVNDNELRGAIRRATLSLRLFPVLCGSALHNLGVQPILDAVVDYLPSPLDTPPLVARDLNDRRDIPCPAESTAPLAALIFKIVSDPFAGKLAYVRVYAGRLYSGQQVLNPRTGHKLRIGRIVRIYADSRENIEDVHAGEIDAVLGLKESMTGDTLCEPRQPLLLESIEFPDPVINIALEPASLKDRDTISLALQHLAEEDPTFRIHTEEDTGQTILAGMGELHLEVLIHRLEQEHDVKVRIGRPRVSYLETIRQPAQGIEGRFVHQTGGHGQYGHVVIDISPAARGEGLTVLNKIAGGAIPKIFIPAVEKGIRLAADSGVIGGIRLTDLQVTLVDGSHHSVDSSEFAYQTAAANAFKAAVMAAGPQLLEPIFNLEVILPKEHMGEVLGQLANRRCDIQNTELREDGTERITALAPIAEMFGYATLLRSATHGRGLFTLEFDHYAVVPAAIAAQMQPGTAPK